MKNICKIILAINCQLLIGNCQLFSQPGPTIQWQNTIGGPGDEALRSVQQTTDGGYILGGESNSGIGGDKTEFSNGADDYWMVKTDASGTIQWQNTIGGIDSDYLTCIRQTADGGYILGGRSRSNMSGDKSENSMGGYDYWIVKTDALGNIQWQNTIGGADGDYLECIQQTSDGGYILGGRSTSNISGDKTENCLGGSVYGDYWIVKTDGSGNIKWQNTIGGSNEDLLMSIEQTVDGGYILGGYSSSDISVDKTEDAMGQDYWIIKTDTAGNILWQNTIGGSGTEYFCSIQQTADEGYILGGGSNSHMGGDKTEDPIGSYDYWIIKTDSSGNIQWQNTIGGSAWEVLYSIQQTSDGGYFLGGWSDSHISGDKTENTNGLIDYWVIKTDATGNILWQNTIGGSDDDLLYCLQQTQDGGYIFGGLSWSSISGDKTENIIGWGDFWVIKLAPDTITGISNFQFPTSNFQFFPNPLTTQSKLTFKNPNKEKFLFTLYDITGRVTESVSTTNNEIILSKGSKQPGVYLFGLKNINSETMQFGKIIIN